MSFFIEEYTSKAAELHRPFELIEETTRYARNLIGQGLPVIFSTHHLAEYIGLPYPDIKYLLDNRSDLYEFYEIKKKKGGFRQIVVPHSSIKLVQYFIYSEILAKVTVSQQAFGFVPGRSILDNAKHHAEKSAILNVDLFKFFDCIKEARVYGNFHSLGYAKNLSIDLAKLCTVTLPQSYYDKFSPSELIDTKR